MPTKTSRSPAPFETLSADAVRDAFPALARVEYPFADFADDQTQRVYRGGLTVDGDFRSAPKVDWNPYNVVVDGDLVVRGDLDWSDYGAGCFLLVTGNLHARVVHLQGCPNVIVLGDLVADGGVFVHYGDDGGVLGVDGVVRAPVVVADTYFRLELARPPEGTLLASADLVDVPVDFDAEDFASALSPKVLDADGELDDTKLLKVLRAGGTILRQGVVPPWLGTLARIDALDPETTTVDFSSAPLRGFPEGLLRLRALRTLRLAETPLGALPEELALLTHLEELDLRECGLSSLPESIGRLANLRVLRLDDNPLDRLPTSLAELTSLRTLSLAGTTFELPKALAKLRLESLDLSRRALPATDDASDDARDDDARDDDELDLAAATEPVPFPEVVTRIRSLRALDLGDTDLDSLPDSLLRLKKLETLRLSGSLGRLTTLPALHELPALKSLQLGGGTRGPVHPPATLLDAVWSLSSLEELSIDRWSDEDDEDARGRRVRRRGPTSLPADAFARMPRLRVLDASFTPLRALPASFFGLQRLENVTLRSTALGARAVAQIVARFPEGVRFDLRDLPTREETSMQPAWKKVHALVKKASETYGSDARIAAFEKALAACKPGGAHASYDELYAAYGLMLELGTKLKSVRAAKPRADLRARCVEAATRAIERLPEGPRWHFTERGAFEEEVERQARNARAWFGMETAKDAARLDEALAEIDRALTLARSEDTYLRDTKVRILLRAGRDIDAFAVAATVLDHRPDDDDLRDIAESAAYRAWRAAEGTA